MISLIVAISKNRAIGKDNKLLWYIPEDMKRFRAITSGHPVVMGRKTFESIGRPLPNRTNIVITRDRSYKPEGVVIAHSLDEAMEIAKQSPHLASPMQGEGSAQEIFILGGGQIFEQVMHIADRLYITVIDADVPDADAFFPEYPHFNKVLFKEDHEHDGLKFTFYELEKQ
jgi:dihydrofolate reductase